MTKHLHNIYCKSRNNVLAVNNRLILSLKRGKGIKTMISTTTNAWKLLTCVAKSASSLAHVSRHIQHHTIWADC